MRYRVALMLAGFLCVSCASTNEAGPEPSQAARKAETRPFHMGFTTWPFGPTDEDKAKTVALISQHADMVCLHLDGGIPWVEAAAGLPYHENVQREIEAMARAVPDGKALYLALGPLNNNRDGMARYNGAEAKAALPPPWDSMSFDDPRAITAFSRYANDLIARLRPKFVNFGIESLPGLAEKKPEQWPAFRTFLREVYKNIKGAHPEVLAGVSMSIAEPGSAEYELVRKAYSEIADSLDYIGISTYPYSGPPWGPGDGNPAHMPKHWLSRVRDIAGDKPLAVCETGFIGEDIEVSMLKWDIPGTPEWQAAYVEMLMEESRRLDMLFVTWWTIADFDKLDATFTGWAKDVSAIWRDTGLFDGELAPRPALEVWDQWLAVPRAEP